MSLNRMIACVGFAALVFGAGCGQKAKSTAAPAPGDVVEFDSAVRDGDTDIVSRLIKAKPEMINARDTSGKTPLTIATEKGDQDMANLLRKHGGHE